MGFLRETGMIRLEDNRNNKKRMVAKKSEEMGEVC